MGEEPLAAQELVRVILWKSILWTRVYWNNIIEHTCATTVHTYKLLFFVYTSHFLVIVFYLLCTYLLRLFFVLSFFFFTTHIRRNCSFTFVCNLYKGNTWDDLFGIAFWRGWQSLATFCGLWTWARIYGTNLGVCLDILKSYSKLKPTLWRWFLQQNL